MLERVEFRWWAQKVRLILSSGYALPRKYYTVELRVSRMFRRYTTRIGGRQLLLHIPKSFYVHVITLVARFLFEMGLGISSGLMMVFPTSVPHSGLATDIVRCPITSKTDLAGETASVLPQAPLSRCQTFHSVLEITNSLCCSAKDEPL